MVIKKMERSNLFRVAELEQQCFSDPWSLQAFKDSLKRRDMIFFTVEENLEIIGYCGMMCVLDEGQIVTLAVAPDYRRMGFARKMITYLIEVGVQGGISLFSLEVRESNKAAINLYTSCGFIPSGRRKGYYSKPKEDAILMELDLANPETLERLGVDDSLSPSDPY